VASPTALEIVQAVWDAWYRRDNDAVFALYAEDIEFAMYPGLAMPDEIDTYYGHEGVKHYHRGIFEIWADFASRAEDLEDLGDGRILVRTFAGGRGRRGRVPVEMTTWNIFEVDDGKIVRVLGYPTEAAARAAAAS